MSDLSPTRLEEAMANMLPPTDSMLYDGWLLRFNTGTSRNPNSVWPLYPGSEPLESKVEFCEQQYSNRGLTCHFRLSEGDGPEAIQDLLLERGYTVQNPNHLLTMEQIAESEPGVVETDLQGWLDTLHRVDPLMDQETLREKRLPLARITLPARYGFVERDGEACSYGRAVQENDLYQLAELWTTPNLRSQGLGTQLIRGLLRLGREAGTRIAFLPVSDSNHGARRLYERLGFSRVYGFRYLSPSKPV